MKIEKGLRSWLAAALVLLGTVLLVGAGCSAAQVAERPADPAALDMAARNFHKNMRWARWEEASQQVHEAAREGFLGRYEELGDDYRVVELALRKVEFSEDGFEATLEVEQEWYELPDTTVRQERFVERWVSEKGVWWMRERITREAFRAREREERDAPGTADPTRDEAPSLDERTPEASPSDEGLPTEPQE
ncbi:hypothetical protein DV096_09905 [Bradymonadaceae bacterium TMQ3]|nr:hypothetical protein DV096_09905 [Bradymonadaceae bacterium TMQ3]TXC75790.1 hypothetical protein FRC91_09810 [Bradymonadales bacterium TMQ1]